MAVSISYTVYVSGDEKCSRFENFAPRDSSYTPDSYVLGFFGKFFKICIVTIWWALYKDLFFGQTFGPETKF